MQEIQQPVLDLLTSSMAFVPLKDRVFAIEYESDSGLWCVGLKRPSTFEKAGDIEIWTNFCKSLSLTRAIEMFVEGIPNLVIE